MRPTADVPMTINLMAPVDRYGRGGDHKSFDNRGFTAIRLMCANESGDGSGTANTRVHTTYDEGGKDLNADGALDSFYVGFNYMKRNGIINGTAIVMAADAPVTPTYSVANIGNNNIQVKILSSTSFPKYRIGIRSSAIDFDTVYTTTKLIDTFSRPASSTGYYYVSAASLDSRNVTSFFGDEKTVAISSKKRPRGSSFANEEYNPARKDYELLQNYPNPFDEDTWITVFVNKNITDKKTRVNIYNNQGTLLKSLPLVLNPGNNQVLFNKGNFNKGILIYSLVIDNIKIDSKMMVYAN